MPARATVTGYEAEVSMTELLQPSSGLEILERLAARAVETLTALLRRSAIGYHDINANSDFVVIGWNKWRWKPLPDDAQPLVGDARRAHDELVSFARLAFTVAAPDRIRAVDDLSSALLRLIEQPNGSLPAGPPSNNVDEIIAGVEPRVAGFLAEVARLPTAHGNNERLLVADTSALLDRPQMQDWRLDGGPWTVVFVPQVLAELDDKKRDPRVAAAADKVIRQLDEFDRRGDTFVGVPLAGRLRAREIAVGPDMTRTLPWLNAETPDDLIVASALELVLRDLRGRVALLASDRNVRNKARLAGLSTVATNQL